MAECALCGCYETEHEETTPGSRFLDRCRVRIQLAPPTELVPEGCYERCDCPGFEPTREDYGV